MRVSSRSAIPAAMLAGFLASGCTSLVGRPATPLTIKREDPGIVLCQSERVGGGIRLIGVLDKGIYPITRVTLEYKTASPSETAPTVTSPGGKLALANARAEKVAYRKGADEVSFTISADAARSLANKVLWYRWIVEYDRNGSMYNDVTDVHRTSIDEAGLPRSPGTPGPDSSVALPTTRRR
jgi:hypothetical protein